MKEKIRSLLKKTHKARLSYRQNAEKLRSNFLAYKKDNIVILLLILAVIGIIIIMPFLPDYRPGIIKNELASWCYNVEHVEFTFVKTIAIGSEWVYKASEPILHNGIYVEYWQITRHNLRIMWPGVRNVYFVKPYG